jgi:hypothetical protein
MDLYSMVVSILALMALIAWVAYSLGSKSSTHHLESAERVWQVTKTHSQEMGNLQGMTTALENLKSSEEVTRVSLDSLTRKVNAVLTAYVQSGTIKAARLSDEMIGEREQSFSLPSPPPREKLQDPDVELRSGQQRPASEMPPSGWGVDPDKIPNRPAETRRRASSESDTSI